MKSNTSLILLRTAIPLLVLCGSPVWAQKKDVAGDSEVVISTEKNDNLRRGLFNRLFFRDKQSPQPGPVYTDKVHDVYMDRESDTIDARIDPRHEAGTATRENDPVERYPHIPGYNTIKNSSQKDIEELIERIYEGYESRIAAMNPADLNRLSAGRYEDGRVHAGETVWENVVRDPIWPGHRSVRHSMDDVCIRVLEYSNQVKVFKDLPLIRETAIQEADGEFDTNLFLDGRIMDTNEPNGSTLLSGQPGNVRFRERNNYLEGGFRKKFYTGTEATISNRFSTLNNNSTFLRPANQGASELVLSVVHPLMEGGGYHYNHSKIKIAKYDARMATSEFLRQLQSHLVEVNRSYWSLFYARASYLLNREIVADTADILERLEERSDLDALESEVLRARASLLNRKTGLNRSEMAVRNAEDRLRALINDPDQDIGSNVEMIPAGRPVFAFYQDDVRKVATDALRNRPEIMQGFDQLRTAIVRRDMQKNEKWPTLNLVAEMMLGDIEGNDAVGRAFNDQFGDGTGYSVGFQFEKTMDNDEERARLLRSEVELRQQANQLKVTIDTVLLESVVTYRELATAYRDMQGRFGALRASKEELRQLKDRLEVDTGEGEGRTTAYQLQLILDSMDRRQGAEDAFLDAVVSYNASFTGLERARGTLLRTEGVQIERVRDTDDTHPIYDVERLQLTKETKTAGPKNGKSKYVVYDADDFDAAKGVGIPEWDNFATSEAVSEESPQLRATVVETEFEGSDVAGKKSTKKKWGDNLFDRMKSRRVETAEVVPLARKTPERGTPSVVVTPVTESKISVKTGAGSGE